MRKPGFRNNLIPKLLNTCSLVHCGQALHIYLHGKTSFFCNELRIEHLPFIARLAVHSNPVKKWGQRMWEEYGKRWIGRKKAGIRRRDRGNGGMMVDQYLNN